MQIAIHTRGFTLTDSLRAHVQRRLGGVLAGLHGAARRVQVRLSDVNGTRGGVDKRCQVDVAMPGMTRLVVADTRTDLYAAIDRASARLKQTLARRRQATRTGRRVRPEGGDETDT